MALLQRSFFSASRLLSTKIQPLTSIVQTSCQQTTLSTVLQCTCLRLKGNVQALMSAGFHSSQRRYDLSEFLDDEKNWSEETVKVGRPWKLDELRIKSNGDLHKLWYVLLKERNMLMTMEAEYERQNELFPSPERIFKVEESMENLLSVVKERDEAYSLLETGKSTDPDGSYVRNFLGLKVFNKHREHSIPRFMNETHRILHPPFRKSMLKYITLYKEQQRMQIKRERKRYFRNQKKMLEKFPHLKQAHS